MTNRISDTDNDSVKFELKNVCTISNKAIEEMILDYGDDSCFLSIPLLLEDINIVYQNKIKEYVDCFSFSNNPNYDSLEISLDIFYHFESKTINAFLHSEFDNNDVIDTAQPWNIQAADPEEFTRIFKELLTMYLKKRIDFDNLKFYEHKYSDDRDFINLEKLLPCTKCGGIAAYKVTKFHDPKLNRYSVKCKSCYATTKQVRFDSDNEIYDFEALKEVTELWNSGEIMGGIRLNA